MGDRQKSGSVRYELRAERVPKLFVPETKDNISIVCCPCLDILNPGDSFPHFVRDLPKTIRIIIEQILGYCRQVVPVSGQSFTVILFLTSPGQINSEIGNIPVFNQLPELVHRYGIRQLAKSFIERTSGDSSLRLVLVANWTSS